MCKRWALACPCNGRAPLSALERCQQKISIFNAPRVWANAYTLIKFRFRVPSLSKKSNVERSALVLNWLLDFWRTSDNLHLAIIIIIDCLMAHRKTNAKWLSSQRARQTGTIKIHNDYDEFDCRVLHESTQQFPWVSGIFDFQIEIEYCPASVALLFARVSTNTM